MVGSKHHPASDSCLNTSASESSLHRPLHCASLINNSIPNNLTSLRHNQDTRPRTEGASGSHDNSHEYYYYQPKTKLFLELQQLPHFDYFTLAELIREHPLSHLISQFYPSRDGSGLVILFSYFEEACAFLHTYFDNIIDTAFLRPTYSRRNKYSNFRQYQQPTYERRPRPMMQQNPDKSNDDRQSQPQITTTSPPKNNIRQNKTKPKFIPPPAYLLRPTHSSRSTQTIDAKTSADNCSQTRNNLRFETWTQTKRPTYKDAAISASPITFDPSLYLTSNDIDEYIKSSTTNEYNKLLDDLINDINNNFKLLSYILEINSNIFLTSNFTNISHGLC